MKKVLRIDGHRVLCQSRSYCQNPNGWYITVNDQPRRYCNILDMRTAAESILTRNTQTKEVAIPNLNQQNRDHEEVNDCICGCKNLEIVGVTTTKRVNCIPCGRSGPVRTTIEAAIADWNRQTAAPELLDAAKTGLETLAMKPGEDGRLSPWNVTIHGQPTEAAQQLIDGLIVIFDAAIAKAEPKP